jgi:segregation and condensation protein A
MPDDSAVAHPPPDGPTAAPRGDPLWDDWETPPRVPSAPVLHLDGFDGPMDLLLDLAERQRIDLGRISVVALVEQFVAAMDRLTTQVPVERRADWVVVATRLVLLRSQLMFPASPAAVAEAEQEAARAIARLDALRVVRAAAAWLQARPQLGHDVFARPRSGPDPRVASYMALMEACLTVLRGREGLPDATASVYHPSIPELFRVPGALVRMRAKLAEIGGAEPFEVFLPQLPRTSTNWALLARSAVGSTFMAALELARGAELALDQDAAFQGIVVTPLAAPVPDPVTAQAHK